MLSSCFKRGELVVSRALGALLWDRDGQRYIDLFSARSAANLGHRHPEIVSAIALQLDRLVHVTNDFHVDVQDAYAQALEAFMPEGLTRYYFCNSGAEAVEAALKLARARTGRPGVLSFSGGFHGRTFGALSATSREAYRAPFQPLVPGIGPIAPRIEEVRAALAGGEVGAVIFEPVLGEGGVRPLGDDFIRALRDATAERGVLLVADEVQTGFGRCGGRFYCERIGVRPDVLLASKSVAGGIALGIVATTPALDFLPGEHGSTFSGHPLACAAGLAALRVFERERLDLRALDIEERLRASLAPALELPGIRGLRVVGAMAGLEIDPQVISGTSIVGACLRRGVLVNFTNGAVLRIMPPLTIEYELLSEGLGVLLDVLRSSPRG